ncbi:hypothetical protein DRQ53_01910 [bacterium]|nr:MAG: hypothetical protein DRQ53_01910 [bacterium]
MTIAQGSEAAPTASRPAPSHPIVGWAFVLLGCAGLLLNSLAWLWRCRTAEVSVWPLAGDSVTLLAAVLREALPAAILLVLGVMIPLQRLAAQRHRVDLLSRLVTGSLLTVFGGYWLLRLNTVGYASLWARREMLGDLVLPAALLENRVWMTNIMLVLFVALLSLPLNSLVRRLLARQTMPRAHWGLWLVGSLWWVGLAAVLLLAGIS